MTTTAKKDNKGLVRGLIAGIIVLAIAFMTVLPSAFDQRWTFWSPESTETTEAAIPAEESETSVPSAPADEEETETPLPPAAPINEPDVKLVLTFKDGDTYVYLPELWEMSFGDVWGIQMTGEGFEKIDTLGSTAKVTIPDGYYAILNTDGMGNYKGTAELDGNVVDFDKGNPTIVGSSVIIPPGTKISIPFAGNDSSGALLVLSEDINLLQEYMNTK